MILFPAIDLKDGECVRLKLGDQHPPIFAIKVVVVSILSAIIFDASIH